MKFLAMWVLLFSFLGANVGEIVLISGKVNIIRDTKIFSAQKGMSLKIDDVVNTFERSRVQIRFEDNTIVTLGKESRFLLRDYLYEEQKNGTDFSFTKGFFKVVTGKIGKISPESFKLSTRTATIGIRGTEIDGFVSPQKEIITCTKGAIWVEAYGKRVDVDAGESTIIAPDTPPTKPKNYTLEKLIREGIIAFEGKEYQKSLAIFNRLVGIDDQNPIFFYYLGKIRFALHEYPEAIRSYKKVLALDASHMKSHYELGLVYYTNDETQKAIEEFDIVVSAGNEKDEVQPHVFIMSHYWLGVIYRDQGEPERAVGHLKKVLGFKLKRDFRDKVREMITRIEKQAR